MPHRAVSPAASENEFDISKALFAVDDGISDDDTGTLKGAASLHHTGDVGLDLDADSDFDATGDGAFIAVHQAASNRKAGNLKGKTVKKGGGFQAMGLNGALLKAITRKGFSVPTPIQRKTIPLVLDGQDVVGMARTGSGKTAAFVIPMMEKLKTHSVKVGARAVIMSPSRELALQTLKVVKELGRGTDLRTILLVGGDSLEDQFGSMTTNPDIIIATPGRFLHLKVEMSMDLSSIRYVVFDEADRLFEMGFAAQLTEIVHALPTSRQTLLFSATLPKSLVEFARAGLQEPKLVRLDAESKISPDLESAFFTVKSAEKEGALLHILQDIIGMPTGETEAAMKLKVEQNSTAGKKRKRAPETSRNDESPTAHSTIVFAATKHHVEYLASLLRSSGYAVSYVYGSLDQTARKMQVQDFRMGMTNILVVTDVAARGIDIPVLANVINYDFPSQPKVFVHRVGRTARAGKKGWSYNLVRDADLPYLLDLQLFLSKRLILGRRTADHINFAEDVVVGSLVRNKLERCCEWVNKLLEEDEDVFALRGVSVKGEKLYTRTRNAASSESAKRAKELVANKSFMELNMLFNDTDKMELVRERMLAQISSFRPNETVFEIGKRGTTDETAEVIKKRREKIENRHLQERAIEDKATPVDEVDTSRLALEQDPIDGTDVSEPDMDEASEDELEVTFSQSSNRKDGAKESWQDSEHFMSYTPKTVNVVEDRGYGVHSGSYDKSRNSNFVLDARDAAMDLNNDESKSFAEPSKARGMRWDKKNKKYVMRANDEDGSKGARYVRGESGQKIAASFRSGRYDTWRKSNKVDRLPRIGETEKPSAAQRRGDGWKYKHRAERAPKEADKFRDDYYKRKKRVEEAKQKRIGKFRDGGGKSELRGVEDVRKQRNLRDKRREKNARPAKKRKI